MVETLVKLIRELTVSEAEELAYYINLRNGSFGCPRGFVFSEVRV